MQGWKTFAVGAALILAACSSSPKPAQSAAKPSVQSGNLNYTPIPGKYALADRVAFAQKDPRWASQTLGGSGESLETDGCLVTATAMALGNLGFTTDPGDLNKRLKSVDGFTRQGWLIWSAIDKVTDGEATARYYDSVSSEIIDECITDGFYPLARFILPSGRSHWAVILHRSEQGFHMRDPLHPSGEPLIFPRNVDAFKAVRCVGKA